MSQKPQRIGEQTGYRPRQVDNKPADKPAENEKTDKKPDEKQPPKRDSAGRQRVFG
jgi:hypothetical protein